MSVSNLHFYGELTNCPSVITKYSPLLGYHSQDTEVQVGTNLSKQNLLQTIGHQILQFSSYINI